MKFVPCQGRNACREDDSRCLTCGRTLEEIAELRRLTDALSALAQRQRYENLDEFLDYVSHRVRKKAHQTSDDN